NKIIFLYFNNDIIIIMVFNSDHDFWSASSKSGFDGIFNQVIECTNDLVPIPEYLDAFAKCGFIMQLNFHIRKIIIYVDRLIYLLYKIKNDEMRFRELRKSREL